MSVSVSHSKSGPGFFIRALWFIFIGWWATGIASALAWAICVTVIGLPLGFWIFNRIPTVLTLRPRRQTTTTVVSADGSQVDVLYAGSPQHSWLLRIVYFVLIGWWFSAIWISIAWVLCVLILTLPLGVMMYNRVSAITTLHRY